MYRWILIKNRIVDKTEKHIILNNIFFKFFRLWDNVEKHSRAGRATVENMAHVHCVVDT
jgi:hypothetical protein